MTADRDVLCWRCGDPYRRHPHGGPCTANDHDGRCRCPGFRWIDPAADIEHQGYERVHQGS